MSCLLSVLKWTSPLNSFPSPTPLYLTSRAGRQATVHGRDLRPSSTTSYHLHPLRQHDTPLHKPSLLLTLSPLKQASKSKHAIKTNKQANKQANRLASVHASNAIKGCEYGKSHMQCKQTHKQANKQANMQRIKDVYMEIPASKQASTHTSKHASKQASRHANMQA